MESAARGPCARTCGPTTTGSGACPCTTTASTSSSLILEGAQAGLSWSTILDKREGYRRASPEFDAAKVARFTPAKIEKILLDPGIVRNRQKVMSAVTNARAFLELQARGGSSTSSSGAFVGGEPIVNRWEAVEADPGASKESDALAAGAQEARLQVRRLDDHVRAHAGVRAGQRSPDCCWRWKEVQAATARRGRARCG